ncbi:MAG TPA: cytochrome c peroxidase [Gammaproteobacteria bacterium]
MPIRLVAANALLLGAMIGSASASAQLPPVPVPAENPITEAKRVLGKMLFWDEQLSSNDTVACGTCHRPAAGGADPRVGRNKGTDDRIVDDVWGSPGIVAMNEAGEPVEHPIFGLEPQVTPRVAPSNFAALWASEQFWDGRAGSEFADPLTGEVVIASGGSLENQALVPLMNPVEMTRPGRTWDELTAKLAGVPPLALARDLPPDVASAIETSPGYPSLFEAAFGSPAITPVRIAFAIATYERTLVADQTPWDRYIAGDESALTERGAYGWRLFQRQQCVNCHEPPLFTNNDFLNIGLRGIEFDRGRQIVTGDEEDAGEMKVPSLRNVALRKRYMHTGEFSRLPPAILFYNNNPALPGRDDIPGGGVYFFSINGMDDYDLAAFLTEALVDPRVANEIFPFDRPRLKSETTP